MGRNRKPSLEEKKYVQLCVCDTTSGVTLQKFIPGISHGWIFMQHHGAAKT